LGLYLLRRSLFFGAEDFFLGATSFLGAPQ
jgi:hypothetical protein